MSKAGRILLLLVAIFAIVGAHTTTFAATGGNFCSSSLVSKATCGEGLNVCTKPTPTEGPKQVQSAVITLTPKNITGTNTQQPTPTNLPSAPVLSGQMASDGATLNSNAIFDLVNQYRASLGLTAFEKDDKVCELAATRSTEIPAEIERGSLHSGLYNRNLPYWIWENAKYGSDEQGTVAWWLASPIHHQSIVGDYKFSCVKCSGSYCSELFTSFSPK